MSAVKRLLVGGALALVLVGSGLAADPALLNLIMPDARVLAGVDVTRCLASPLGRFLLAQLDPQTEQNLALLKQLTGFDPRTDLRQALLASPGSRTGRFLIVATGTFDPDLMLATARDRQAELIHYRDVDIIVFHEQGSPSVALAFLSPSLAAGGDPDSVRLAIDRYRQGGPPLSPELASRISSVSAGADAWFVSLIPGTDLIYGKPAANVLSAIQEASASVRLGTIVVASAELRAVGPEEAAALADLVRLMASVARLNRKDPKAAALLELIEALEVSAAGSTVSLRLAIPETQLENLLLTLRPR